MTPLPTITIGITAFNAQNSIAQAIESALAQHWPAKDIVVVDDASTDMTASICEEFKTRGVRLYKQVTNQGVAAARNRILKEAAGEFVAFFDDDDRSSPDRLEKQYARITTYEALHPDAAMVICHTARIQYYPDGTQRTERTMGTNERLTAPHGADVARRILYGRPLPDGFGACATCSQMARRALYMGLGGFDESFRRGEDTDLNIRLALQGGHFAGIAEPLVMQTMTLSSDKQLDRERALMHALLDKHKEFLSVEGQYELSKSWLDLRCDLIAGNTNKFLYKILALLIRHPIKTSRRLLWAMPNARFNLHQRGFHKNGEHSE